MNKCEHGSFDADYCVSCLRALLAEARELACAHNEKERAVRTNDEEWRLKYLEAEQARVKAVLKAESHESAWYSAKSEYGTARAKMSEQIRLLTKDRDEANAELVLHKEERLRLRSANMRLQRLLSRARDVIAANRLVLGEYMGPEHINKLTDEIDAAVPKDT